MDGQRIIPKLTRFDATMIVISLVIGIGIFRTPAIVAGQTGTLPLFFAAWVLGGGISLIGALTFAEIGSRFPHPGAFYRVVAECYHPSVAFMLNWTTVTIVNGTGGAAVAMIGAEYLAPVVFGTEDVTLFATQCTAAALALVLLGINAIGIKSGARTQNVLTVAKILMMLVLGSLAFVVSAPLSGAAELPSSATSPLGALALGLIAVFYTYGGYQSAINLAGDIARPVRTLPRAIVRGMIVVVAAYLLMNAAFAHSLGLTGVANAPLVAATLARKALGPAGEALVSVAIFLSALGFLNVTLLHIPRAYYAMARDGTLPAAFMRVHPKSQSQHFTLAFFGALIVASIFFLGTFERMVNYVMLFDGLNNALVASTLFVLRKRGISADTEPYRVPFYPVFPSLFVVVLVGVSVNVALTQPGAALVGVAFVGAGYPLYLMMKKTVGTRGA